MRRRRRVGDGPRFRARGLHRLRRRKRGGGEYSIGLGGGGAAGSNAASALSMYPTLRRLRGLRSVGEGDPSGSGTYTAAGLGRPSR